MGERRTRLDFAPCIKELVDVHYPGAERIVLSWISSTSTARPRSTRRSAHAEARRLAAKLEIHHTPRHGSWLNMAELELSVLARPCLRQRFPNQATMRDAVTASATRRNAAIQAINWQFTTEDARIKLRRLYPAFDA